MVSTVTGRPLCLLAPVAWGLEALAKQITSASPCQGTYPISKEDNAI